MFIKLFFIVLIIIAIVIYVDKHDDSDGKWH
jgi:hypothetical protein